MDCRDRSPSLAVRIEQLKAEDQQVQQQLESMRKKFEARLERLEGLAKGKRKSERR